MRWDGGVELAYMQHRNAAAAKTGMYNFDITDFISLSRWHYWRIEISRLSQQRNKIAPPSAQHPQLPAAVVNPQAVPNIQVAAAAVPAAAVLAPAHVVPPAKTQTITCDISWLRCRQTIYLVLGSTGTCNTYTSFLLDFMTRLADTHSSHLHNNTSHVMILS